VSDDLVVSILSREGLIYLDSDHSANSFWVEFEKDYALRAKKLIYAYDQTEQRFVKSSDRARDLAVFQNYYHRDLGIARAITEFMKTRYFSVWLDMEMLEAGDNWRRQSRAGSPAR
jgi:hypothetical protein